MFRFFRPRKQAVTAGTISEFHGKGIIDVTNFAAMTPDDPLGYMCGCNIAVLQNGQIEIRSDDSENELLESFSGADIVCVRESENHQDPMVRTDVSVMIEEKNLKISFQSQETQKEFCMALAAARSHSK